MVGVVLVQHFLRRRREDIGSRNRDKVMATVRTGCKPNRSLDDRLNGTDVAVANIGENFIPIHWCYFCAPKPIDVDFALIIVVTTRAV